MMLAHLEAACRGWQELTITVNSRPCQGADFRCDRLALQGQLAATSGKTRPRPSADLGRRCAKTRLRLAAAVLHRASDSRHTPLADIDGLRSEVRGSNITGHALMP